MQELKLALEAEAKKRQDFREWIDEKVKAEFINGEMVLHSPVKKKQLEVSRLLGLLLNLYTIYQNTGTVWVEKAMISLTRNDYEPDIVFFSKEKSKNFSKDQMLFPAPDFVVEILSNRTAHKDRGIKKDDYAQHGIKEYWIIDPEKQRVEQYLLMQPEDTTYFEPFVYTISDEIEGKIVKGFKIPVKAIFEEEANSQALKSMVN